MLLTRYESILERLFPKLDPQPDTVLIGEAALYDRILKTLNQMADITGVKEKPDKPAGGGEIDLAAYADLLEQADSQ